MMRKFHDSILVEKSVDRDADHVENKKTATFS